MNPPKEVRKPHLKASKRGCGHTEPGQILVARKESVPLSRLFRPGFPLQPSEEGGFHSPLPTSVRFPGLFCSVTERTNHKETPFFGILTWKQAILRIRIFRIEKVRSEIPGAWAGGRGRLRSGVNAENHFLPLFFPNLWLPPPLPLPPFLN